MKAFLLCFCLAAGTAIAAGPTPIDKWESGSFSFLPRSFQKDPHLNVMIVTEFTAVGRKAPLADPDHPVYYEIHDGGMASEGDVIAGEQPPTSEGLAAILQKTLASGGYHPSSAAHPPTILIFYRWGSFNKLSTLEDPTGSTQPGSLPEDDVEAQNLAARAALVGGTRFAVDMMRSLNGGMLTQFEHKSPKNEYLMQEVYANHYFVIATAYDIAAAAQNKQVILWRTKISTDSQGVMMNESLPGLIAVAGPYFGHETNGPVRLNRQVVQEGHVEVGTPIVKGVLPSDVPYAPAAPAKSHP